MAAAGRRFVLVETTFPVPKAGLGTRLRRFARAAVEQRLAACANVSAVLDSFYRWEGKLERAMENLVSFKTPRDRANALVEWIRSHHPYDVPYIAVMPLDVRHGGYARWLVESTRPVKRIRRVRRRR